MKKNIYHQFTEDDITSLKPEMKIGILATVNDEGLPHLSLISTLQACSPTQMIFGQFVEGVSKAFVKRNTQAAFLVLTLDRNTWRGKMNFTHTRQEGLEYDAYNNIPMFRYNAYFGVHTVYYFDLVEQYGKEPLPMNQIIPAAVMTVMARTLSQHKTAIHPLNEWTQQLLNKLDNLKFLGYIGEDGYPVIIPAIQAQAASSGRVIFSSAAYGDEIAAIPAGIPVALYAASFDMETALMRGTYAGVRRVGGFRCGVLDVEWVYNSMPPVPGQIYPPVELKAVHFGE